jgi:hypothetical protein
MPDIMMCKGTDCPFKQACYRYKAVPSLCLQSYFREIPYNHETDSCDYFCQIDKYDKLRDINE